MQHRLKQNKASLYIVIVAAVVLAAILAYIQIANKERIPKLTAPQRTELTAKRKPFFDSCTKSAQYFSHSTTAAAQQYCDCTLQSIVTEYYTDLSKPMPAADDSTNLTDSDAVLNFADHMSAAQVTGIAQGCVSKLRE